MRRPEIRLGPQATERQATDKCCYQIKITSLEDIIVYWASKKQGGSLAHGLNQKEISRMPKRTC